MTKSPFFQRLKRRLSRCSSLLMLFQRSPVVQMFFPQANLMASGAALNGTSFVIATVVGLGAYDSVAGATVVVQVAPATGTNVPVTAGTNVAGAFQIIGNFMNTPESWSVSNGALPTGLTLSTTRGTTATLTGSTSLVGTHAVSIRAWQNAGAKGEYAQGNFNIVVAPSPSAAISTHPASTTINSGGTATLSATATGGAPITYQWYEGTSGVSTTPVGTNSASFTTPALTTTTSYWLKVTNDSNQSGANSNTATVTVRQPAAVTTHPASVTINSGQSTVLSIVASGDTPVTYQWYQGASGITTTPVGTNSASFITPALTGTTNYWVKVTNIANLAGANSNAATVTVQHPAAITSNPEAAIINSGETTTLSVTAIGDVPLVYQWYQGERGVTANPVGTNASTFTTPPLSLTTSYWVKVTNSANASGAISTAAKVTVLLTTPPYAHAMNQSPGLITPSTRGNSATTWFGWVAFNEPGSRAQAIDDNSPDIGTTLGGALFQTTNTQDHVLDNGQFSVSAGTLAEQITVPTSGVEGSEGFTTLVLQIAAPSGSGAFAAPITVGDINGVSATVVLGLNSDGDGQLWATWELTGNQASYTIDISGPDQTNFSFASVVVDTLYSDEGYMPDSVAAVPPSITTASPLSVGIVDTAYSQQLAGTSGTAPYQFEVSSGTLPTGISLSTTGLLSGTPSGAAISHFSVRIYDANVLIATKIFGLKVVTPLTISTVSLSTALVGAPFNRSLSASGGSAPYHWTVSVGSLPAGLTISDAGVLSGSPSVVGTANFTIQVQDANNLTESKTYSLTISGQSITTTMLPTAVKGVNYNFSLSGTGGSLPYTWTVTGQPQSLTITDQGVFSGAPTTPGTFNLTVSLTDGAGFTVSKQFPLTVSTTFLRPVVNPINFPTITIGTPFNHQATALNYPKTFAITGLPKGLKYVASTGVISGIPDVSGIFNVQVSASNTAGKSIVVTARLTVKTLDRGLLGTFVGIVDRHPVNQGLGGLVTVTTTSNGSFTAKHVGALSGSGGGAAAASYAATGRLTATPTNQVSTSVGGQSLKLTLDGDLMTGNIGGAEIRGWRSVWNALANPADNLFGYYSIALELANPLDRNRASVPHGAGFATFNVSLGGALTIVGKTADGQTITSASFLGSQGQFGIYTPLYKNVGTIQGELHLTEDVDGLFAGNAISGTLNWFKQETSGRTYADTFGPVNLTAKGSYLAPASKGSIILGLPEAGDVDVVFTSGGLSGSMTVPNMTFNYTDENKVVLPPAATAASTNSGKVAITLNANTGAVSGSFTLVDSDIPLTRAKVPFLGQVVRTSDGSVKALGYFLLPQIPGSSETIANSPILSGTFKLEQGH